jgi:hypothetical protein
MVREEQTKHPISVMQKRLFFSFRFSVWFFLAITSVSFLLMFLLPAEESFEKGWLNLFFGLLGFSFFLVVLVFFLNTKLIWQTLREFRLAFKTRLWQLAAQKHTRYRWPLRLIIGVGGIFLVIFLIGMWTANLIIGLLVTVALIAFFILRIARKRLDMLSNADKFIEFLSKLDASESPADRVRVSIPTDIFKKMGDLEDVHIQHRRATAIDESHDSVNVSSVLKSRTIITDISKLDEASQLRIEACISDLTIESLSSQALRESGGIWRVPVKETTYEIVCSHDEAAHRIDLLSIKQVNSKQ